MSENPYEAPEERCADPEARPIKWGQIVLWLCCGCNALAAGVNLAKGIREVSYFPLVDAAMYAVFSLLLVWLIRSLRPGPEARNGEELDHLEWGSRHSPGPH